MLSVITNIYNMKTKGPTLTISASAEYIYSAASHARRPDGVLILRDFHKVVKRAGTGDFKV
jgi:hypothetical protein